MSFTRPLILAAIGGVLVIAGNALYKRLEQQRLPVPGSESHVPFLQRYPDARRASAVVALSGVALGVGYLGRWERGRLTKIGKVRRAGHVIDSPTTCVSFSLPSTNPPTNTSDHPRKRCSARGFPQGSICRSGTTVQG